MPRIQRTSDVIEQFSEKAVYYAAGAVACAAVSALLLRYRGDGMFVPLGWMFAAGAVALLGYAAYTVLKVRKVAAFGVECPYCTERFDVADALANADVSCVACNRMIPVKDGSVLSVSQVRCGFCNGLNYYSDKTEALLCESCNHEIPIHHDDGHVTTKRIAKGFAVVDDDALYELVLTGGKETDDLIACLQHMLALNRNQVRELLEGTPVTLLQGITRMKADMLTAQLAAHGGEAEARQLSPTTA